MYHKNTELNSSFSGVKVHPNAFVDPSAELHDGVIIAQGAIVGPDVTIGKGAEIGPNAVISGRPQIGINNKVFPNVFIGLDPQDLKYKGASTEVIIGDNNTFRECVTINKATDEGEKTVIGNNNLLLSLIHILVIIVKLVMELFCQIVSRLPVSYTHLTLPTNSLV